jgi:hypothetical protein
MACQRARFSHVSHTNHQSRCTTGAFLIASRQLLEVRLTHSQQTRRLLLIASFSAVLGWRRKSANQKIGVLRNARVANLRARVTSHGPRATTHQSIITMLRSTHHFHLRRRTILQVVQHQLDAHRDSELVEHSEQVIAHDFLLAGGWTARRVAIVCYFLTAFLGLLGWFPMDGGIKRTVIWEVRIFAVFVLSALWLGARREAIKHSRYRVQI